MTPPHMLNIPNLAVSTDALLGESACPFRAARKKWFVKVRPAGQTGPANLASQALLLLVPVIGAGGHKVIWHKPLSAAMLSLMGIKLNEDARSLWPLLCLLVEFDDSFPLRAGGGWEHLTSTPCCFST